MPIKFRDNTRRLVNDAISSGGIIKGPEAADIIANADEKDRRSLLQLLEQSPFLFDGDASNHVREMELVPIGRPRPPRRTDPTALSSVETQTIENIRLDADGKTPVLDFEVKEDTVSVSIFIEGDPGGTYLINRMDDGAGRSLVSERPEGVPPEEYESNPYDGATARSPIRSQNGGLTDGCEVMAPDDPLDVIHPGRWQFQARGWEPSGDEYEPGEGTVTARIVTKRVSGTPKEGKLNLHLYFTGSDGYTASTAKRSSIIQGALEKVKGLYAKARIQIGKVTYQDLDGNQRLENSGEMNDLMRKGSHKDGVGVYFVSQLWDRFSIGGASGGLPGQPVIEGAPLDGILVTTCMVPIDFPSPSAGADNVGSRTAHELGHYLRLFHIEDDFMSIADPLDDTERFRGNVMEAQGGSAKHFSADQGWIMLRHPSVEITKVEE